MAASTNVLTKEYISICKQPRSAGEPRSVGVVYKIRTAYVLCQQTLISDT